MIWRSCCPEVLEDYRCYYRRMRSRYAHGLYLLLRDSQTECVEGIDNNRHRPLHAARQQRYDARGFGIRYPRHCAPRRFQCYLRVMLRRSLLILIMVKVGEDVGVLAESPQRKKEYRGEDDKEQRGSHAPLAPSLYHLESIHAHATIVVPHESSHCRR